LIAPPVTAVRRLEPLVFGAHYRDKYRHFIRKSLYFAVREGPLATLRKVRSKRLERAIEAEIAILVASIELAGRAYIGVTRHLGGAPIFDPRLVFGVVGERSLGDVVLSEASRLALESYLPVPACPLPEGIVGLLLAENPFLAPLDEISGFERFAVGVGRDSGEPIAVSAANEVADSAAAVTSSVTSSVTSASAAASSTTSNPAIDALPLAQSTTASPGRAQSADRGVYLLGFGGYIREHVLRNFRNDVVLALDHRAELIREAGTPVSVTDSFDEVLAGVAGEAAPLVVVSTYHSDHAWMALRVLDANPGARVFIEKPPVVEWTDLEALLARRRAGAWIDVGFNRRYAPLTARMRTELGALPRPLIFTALVKELKLPPTHWYLLPNQGTRVTGNVCHWLDLAYHLIGVAPTELMLARTGDTVTLAVVFEDGSLATIVATDHGDDLPGVTERIEVRGGGTTVVVDDFRRLEVASATGHRVRRQLRRDKGHAAMYADLRRRWLADATPRYPEADLYWVPWLTDAAAELLRTGERVRTVPGGPELPRTDAPIRAAPGMAEYAG
jgi:predicted dehydrogenase